MEGNEQKRILLVDDDPTVRIGITLNLKKEGYHIRTASSAEEALVLLEKEIFDLIVTDLIMGGKNGISLLRSVKEIRPETSVIILTGYGNLSTAIDAVRYDADDYVIKPCDPFELQVRIAQSLQKRALKQKIAIYEDLIPVCCVCKKIRDDSGANEEISPWLSVEQYMWKRANVPSTSTYCPECEAKAYSQMKKYKRPQSSEI